MAVSTAICRNGRPDAVQFGTGLSGAFPSLVCDLLSLCAIAQRSRSNMAIVGSRRGAQPHDLARGVQGSYRLDGDFPAHLPPDIPSPVLRMGGGAGVLLVPRGLSRVTLRGLCRQCPADSTPD